MHTFLLLGVNVNTYFYSAKYNSFFPSELKNDYINGIGWPEDAIEVTDQVYSEFAGYSSTGKIMVPGENGMPDWGDVAPPIYDEIVDQLEFEKKIRINIANDFINSKQWPGKASLGRLKGNELIKYSLWLDYLDALGALEATSSPDIRWPTPPASAEG